MEEDKTQKDSTSVVDDAGKTEAPSQDAVKTEVERLKKPKSEREKAEFTLQSTARRLSELGGDPHKLLGTKLEETDKKESDDIPDWYKREQAKTRQLSAFERAEQIEDENERELTKETLKRLSPNLDPDEALRIAKGYVLSVKSAEIAKEVARKGQPTRYASAAGAPAKGGKDFFEPTLEEAEMMRVANLTVDDIKKVREQSVS